MTMSVEQLMVTAEQLPAGERAMLAARILDGLTTFPSPVSDGDQLAAVRRRVREVDEGSVSLVPAGDAIEQVRRAVSSVQSRA